LIDAVYILAGGDARRFGSDKNIYLVDGYESLNRIVNILKYLNIKNIFLSVKDEFKCNFYKSILLDIDKCIYDNKKIKCPGPGRALATIFDHATKYGFKKIIILPGDMPWITWRAIKRLSASIPGPGWAAVPLHGNGYVEALFQAHKAPYTDKLIKICKIRKKLRSTDAIRFALGGHALIGSGYIDSFNFIYSHINEKIDVYTRLSKNSLGNKILFIKNINKNNICEILYNQLYIYKKYNIIHLYNHVLKDIKILCKK